jgi:hypothetical protein
MGCKVLDQKVKIGPKLGFRTSMNINKYRPGSISFSSRFVEPGWDLPFIESGIVYELRANEGFLGDAAMGGVRDLMDLIGDEVPGVNI